MLEIYPKVGEGKGYICPVCKCQLSQPERVIFNPAGVLADIECTCCEEDYYQTLPYTYSRQPKLSFLKKFGKVRYEPSEEHQALALLKKIQLEPFVSLEIKRRDTASQVVWLNCLFDEEEIIIERLISAKQNLSKQENLGLIVVLKQELAYLAPVDACEIWLVKEDGANSLLFNDLVIKELHRFDKVLVPNMQLSDAIGSAFFKSIFGSPVLTDSKEDQTVITFFCHPELFWFSSKWEKWLFNKASQWQLQRFLHPYFEKRQLQKFASLAEKLKKEHKVKFYLIGFGRAKAPLFMEDQRMEEETVGVYKKWLPILSQTDFTIGVFGNKLLARAISEQSIDLGEEGSRRDLPNLVPNATYLGDFSNIEYVYSYIVRVLNERTVGQLH